MYSASMLTNKQRALKLRLKGFSYTQISSRLLIPKSTLSNWLCDLQISTIAQEKINKRAHRLATAALLKRNKNQTKLAIQRMLDTRKKSSRSINKFTQRDLLFTGISLYWAEGYKRLQIRHGKERTYHPVAFTNSDPKLIQIFLRFLREICQVQDSAIRAEIRLFDHMNPKNVKNFWQEVTHLPSGNFGKLYYGISKSSQGKRPFQRLPYGTLLIRVNNTELFHTIMGWIEGLAKFGELTI